jgi:antitoxin (DNA-binding transcriptional repressor) of toxin-antitoxin stability system
MNYINLDAKGEAVKQFFLSLPSHPEGTVVEVNGRAVARLVPILAGDNDASNGEHAWIKEKNVRRCFLIDQEIEATISTEEARQLAALQRQMLQHVQQISPLPLDATRRLHEELLAKAEAARNR